MTKATQAIHAGLITVKDPETGCDVELEVLKDPVSGAMMAIDASFLDQVSGSFNSPYNRQRLAVSE
ncbi:MAG: hypothetical protein PHQ60_01970 [Sideroxydans sp.]|nr:hypothetical protein [Sideroxydans sp.]MDD5056609.1 hypothetical protein [Sideroxydans sp.]